MAAVARGDALDWALALARAPGERATLRQRPLPEGIDALLQIAVGHPGESLESAVARTGESEERLVEAARFYLREVLFHSGADAYRVLGLERSASPERIKAHHRWLQQWLHPDRHTSDWDAIFAGRVNAAWNQLRNDERRRTYDEQHPAPHATEPSRPVMLGGAWVHQPVPVEAPQERWRRRAPVIALLAACGALGLLALRDVARDDSLITQQATASQSALSTREPEGLDAFGSLRLPQSPAATGPRERATRALPAAPAADRRATPRVAAEPSSSGSIPELVPAERPLAIAAPVTKERVAPVSNAGKSGEKSAQTVPRVGNPKALTVVAPVSAEVPVAAATPSPGPAKAATPAISSERIRQAQKVGDRLLTFMRTADGRMPPIWDSVPVQQGAAHLRDELRERGGATFSPPDWRVGEREAQMVVDVRHTDGRQGRLGAGLAWREERWLVTRLTMERDW